jgi:hypothetical protein
LADYAARFLKSLYGDYARPFPELCPIMLKIFLKRPIMPIMPDYAIDIHQVFGGK